MNARIRNMAHCGNRPDRNKNKSFYRLLGVICHQGEATKELSKKYQDLLLATIRRADLKPSNYPYTCKYEIVNTTHAFKANIVNVLQVGDSMLYIKVMHHFT